MQRRFPVSALTAARARQHRSVLDPVEALLWAQLRGCRLGVWFRRQVPLGCFIADFLAPSARLVVEVDGGYHRQRVALYARRDAQLGRMGYRVLRLEAELVRVDLHGAVERVRAALATR